MQTVKLLEKSRSLGRKSFSDKDVRRSWRRKYIALFHSNLASLPIIPAAGASFNASGDQIEQILHEETAISDESEEYLEDDESYDMWWYNQARKGIATELPMQDHPDLKSVFNDQLLLYTEGPSLCLLDPLQAWVTNTDSEPIRRPLKPKAAFTRRDYFCMLDVRHSKMALTADCSINVDDLRLFPMSNGLDSSHGIFPRLGFLRYHPRIQIT